MAIVVVLGLWIISGFYVVGPGEEGVIRHFGKNIGRTAPGLHFRLPWPVQQVDIVNVQQIRRIEVGFRTQSQGRVVQVPQESLMLTGDENIVFAQMIIQYRVRDPSAYLFRLRQPDEAVLATTEVALRSKVGNMTIDDALTTGRDQLQEETRAFLQHLLDTYESGILITSVRLQTVDAPDQVKDAFHDVVRAREDREKVINESRGYKEDIIPKARGEAQRILRAAEAYQQERVIMANGDVALFLAVLEEYRKGKDVTRERLYLESMERVLARLEKIVMDGAASSNLLPFLPLRGQAAGSTPAAPAQPAPQPTPAARR
ncbi:MAG: FtsH protease activity modulator HflK [Chloroflexi bacterium]|nr:FtsH protease activity modulator HflK [Chloroflexota bacterium]